MGQKLTKKMLQRAIRRFLAEDEFAANPLYLSSLPEDPVEAFLWVKSDLCLAGTPWFCQVFRALGAEGFAPTVLEEREGTSVCKGEQLPLGTLPFAQALSGERVALNLLQRASAIATTTHQWVKKAEKYDIALLDTRKTTPGLRALEKYAVALGGGQNHRWGKPKCGW